MTNASLSENSMLISLTIARDTVEQFIQSRISLTPELYPTEWYALWVLFTHHDELTLTELAEFFGKEPNTFDHVVDKLHQHDYIIKQRHLLDRRKRVLKLTNKAMRIRDEFLAQAKWIDDQISAHLADQFHPLLQKLRLLHQLSA